MSLAAQLVQQDCIRPSAPSDAAYPPRAQFYRRGSHRHPAPAGVSPGGALGVSPQILFDSAIGDYTPAQYYLCDPLLHRLHHELPTSDLADDAQ